jgi:hypothetical protein
MLNYRNIIVYITLLAMEISWLYALLNAANKSVAGVLSIPLLLVCFLISLGVSRGLRFLHWPKPVLTTLIWLIWPIAMLLMVKIQLYPETDLRDTIWLASIPQAFSRIFSHFEPALLVFLSTAVLWWLGRRLAYIKIGFSSAVMEFQFGMIVLAIVFFVAYEFKLDQSSSLAVTMTFFFLGLIGISISHTGDNPGWLSSWRQGHFPGMLLLSIIIILLSGLLISIIVTPDFLQLIINAFKWIWGMIERVLDFFASLFPQGSQGELPPQPTMTGGEDQYEPIFRLPEWLVSGGRIIWLTIFLAMILVALWRIADQIFSMMRRRSANTGGEVESLKGAFWSDFVNWLKRLVSRIFNIRFGLKNKDKSSHIPPEIASVRQLYSQLLRWAAEGGYQRQRTQTPNEYQVVLNQAISQNQEELDFITREYNNARYGDVLPTEQRLDQLKQKWHNLKNTILTKPEK